MIGLLIPVFQKGMAVSDRFMKTVLLILFGTFNIICYYVTIPLPHSFYTLLLCT